MRDALCLCLCAALVAFAPGIVAAADQASLSIEGRVQHPQKFDLETLRNLPAETVQLSFEGERGTQNSSFTGVRLWTLLDKAGGIDDSAKGAELRHVIKVTGRDGYMVVISTGEIAPEFGGEAALIAFQRDGAMLGFACSCPATTAAGAMSAMS